MIRPITCVGLILACTSGFYLYQTKHRVTVIDRDIAKVVRETGVIRKQIPILAAEWALLNQPDRIQQFADQYLTLKPTDPSQFATLAELDSRLPPMPSPDGTPVASAAPSPEPPPVPSKDAVALAEPALLATAQVPPSTDTLALPSSEATPVPPPSPAAVITKPPASSPPTATAESQPGNQDAEVARPAIEVSDVQQPHEAETAGAAAPAGSSALPPPEVSRVPRPVPALGGSPPVSSMPAETIAPEPSGPAPVAAPVPINVAQIQPQHEAGAGKTRRVQAATVQAPSPSGTSVPPEPRPVPPAAAAVAAPQISNAEADRLAAELAQLRQQREAEAARNRALQEEADRLAAQIAQRQKSLDALRAQAATPRRSLPVPAAPPPASVAARPVNAEAARVAAELAQLKQQHDVEAATNRRLQDEVDRLAIQMGQQQKVPEAPRPKLASAKPLPAPAAPAPNATSNTVESIVTRLRHEAAPLQPPHEVRPPAPAPAPPAMNAQYRPPARAPSPWVDLMDARAALGAGDTYVSRRRLEAAQAALLSEPSRRHYFAAEQISMAVALMNAGATLPALHFLDVAIANAGGGVPYAAESMPPPQPAYPPWAYQP